MLFYEKQYHGGKKELSISKNFYLVKCFTISESCGNKKSSKKALEWLDPVKNAPFKNHNNVFLILVDASTSFPLPLGYYVIDMFIRII